MLKRISLVYGGLMAALALLLTAGTASAQTASTTEEVVAAVGVGITEGRGAVYNMLGNNIGIILILFGVCVGIGLLMRWLRRSAR